jgi:hypothetical protein
MPSSDDDMEWTPADIMAEQVRLALRRECELLERLVEDFLAKHPTLGVDDIIIEQTSALNGVEYVYSIKEKVMASINDWATKAAHRIKAEVNEATGNPRNVSVERLAAIIVLHAEPLITLLAQAKKSHHGGYIDESSEENPCPLYEDKNSAGPCTCGADDWNARIDAALIGERPVK